MGHQGISIFGKSGSKIILKSTPSGGVTYAVKRNPKQTPAWRAHVADCMRNIIALGPNPTQAQVKGAVRATAGQTHAPQDPRTGRAYVEKKGMTAEQRLRQLTGGAGAGRSFERPRYDESAPVIVISKKHRI